MTLKNALVSAAGNAADRLYIEDVFSTYLYTGNGSTQTITNGIDLAGEGGLVWLKSRSLAEANQLFDTDRGVKNRLFTNTTGAQNTGTGTLTSFNSDGFSIGSNNISNTSGSTNASWTFRKAEKFFDVVTYTGTGAAQTISHNLGSVPGCMIVKRTDSSSNWYVYHRSLDPGGNPATAFLALNLTDAANSTLAWTNTQPTSTVFYVGDGVGQNPINQNGATYIAYLFAHDAGGFGADGTENVISCGAFTVSGGAATINLGYEPQFVLSKNITDAGAWFIFDNMRGMPVGGTDPYLRPDSINAESNTTNFIDPTATGFNIQNLGSTQTFIYIAIRRGPMKVPESGTQVFTPAQYNGTKFPTGFPVDLGVAGNAAGTDKWYWQSRLQGAVLLNSASTAAEVGSGSAKFDLMDGYGTGFSTAYYTNAFRRAPGFFDVVCYTGTGSATTVNHNLGVAPEMIIVKARSGPVAPGSQQWCVNHTALGVNMVFITNQATQFNDFAFGSDAAHTSTYFKVGTYGGTNASGNNYVAYLFATLPGVSKVGSYTGTGTTNQIDCGFSGGARFVLIKRTDSTGDWYVWDSARGIVAGNDPYLLINSTAAEVTSTDYVDTYSAGFEISSTAPAGINANGGSYIFLAIA